MEQRYISRICRGAPVNLIGCNGDDVAIERICDFLLALIGALNNRYYPIIIIFDREKRDYTSDQIADSVSQILTGRGIDTNQIHVFVADRETEDWLLLDQVSICQHYGTAPRITAKQGKAGIASLIRPHADYHETTVGVELCGIVDKTVIASKSPTFKRLHDLVATLNCHHF